MDILAVVFSLVVTHICELMLWHLFEMISGHIMRHGGLCSRLYCRTLMIILKSRALYRTAIYRCIDTLAI